MSKDGRGLATLIFMKFSHFDRTALYVFASFALNLKSNYCKHKMYLKSVITKWRVLSKTIYGHSSLGVA